MFPRGTEKRNMARRRVGEGGTTLLLSSLPEEKKFNTGDEVHQFKPLLASLCAERNYLKRFAQSLQEGSHKSTILPVIKYSLVLI